jgi:hypothetical protein
MPRETGRKNAIEFGFIVVCLMSFLCHRFNWIVVAGLSGADIKAG